MIFNLVVVALLYNGVQGAECAIAHQLHTYWRMNYLRQKIRVIINNGDERTSFFMNSGFATTTADLYERAEAIGMLHCDDKTVLLDYTGRFVPDDPSMGLLDILPPLCPANLVMPRQLILNVLTMEQMDITVHITNGDITKSFLANAGTPTNEVYQVAMHIGILKNCHHFWLRRRYHGQAVLENGPNPTPALWDFIDEENPDELHLIVSPIPEGVLLFRLLNGMAPNENVPSWNYAQFCSFNPWHPFCAKLSRRIEYEDNMDPLDVIRSTPVLDNKAGDWANEINVVNVPSWSGALNLAAIPPSVRLMKVEGQFVSVNFKLLRFTSLTELTLNFREVIGWDIAALSGSSLKVLRLPCYGGLPLESVDAYLELLTWMRAQDQIQLDKIYFGRIEGVRSMIYYNPETRNYTYFQEVD